ncbi:MAG: diadenylate cyclase CdaA [Clostridia bacterium]|nr:diadenylate cyclase CdaA [Clostridia bacterium]
MISEISTIFSQVISIFSTYNWLGDTLDILLLVFAVYYLLKIIKDSRALTLAKGLLIFIAVYFLVNFLDMKASTYLLKKFVDNLLVILVVLFAPELRTMLEKLGNSRRLISLTSIFSKNGKQNAIAYNENLAETVNSICKAAQDMSDSKIGALIVFEKETPLGDVIHTGTVVDAAITPQIIGNIFYPKSPLHDGAAVVRANRLHAAGCILPLTSRNNDVAKELGTRHRAAIGVTEQSDAIVLVVSEETGAIAIAENGTLHRDLSDGEARELLLNSLSIEIKEHKGGDDSGK